MEPYQARRFLFYQGRNLYVIHVSAISKPGVLAAVAEIIARKGLNIIYCSTMGVKGGELGRISFFIDFTGSDVKLEELTQELEELEDVESVVVVRPRLEGFIADESFPLLIDDVRGVIFDEAGLRGFFVDFRERLGSGGEAMLYHLGLEVGREWVSYITTRAEEIGAERLEDIAYLACSIFTSLGFGQLEIIKLSKEPPYIKLRIYNSIECTLVRRKREKPFSQFIRGAITGVSNIILNTEMFAREIKCVTKGDPYCEFEIIRKRTSKCPS